MNKFKPQNLVMAEAVPFGQRWTYHSEHPIEEMITSEYYKVETHRFRVGDDIRALEIQGGEVVAFSDMLIVAVNPIKFEFIQPPRQVKQKAKTVEVVQGDRCWELREGTDIIDTFDTKGEADKAKAAYLR